MHPKQFASCFAVEKQHEDDYKSARRRVSSCFENIQRQTKSTDRAQQVTKLTTCAIQECDEVYKQQEALLSERNTQWATIQRMLQPIPAIEKDFAFPGWPSTSLNLLLLK